MYKTVTVETAIRIIKEHYFDPEIINGQRISFDVLLDPSEQPFFESVDIENNRVNVHELRNSLGY